ncbi:MAG: hypothetical protein IT203_08510 [Fimbriimonadaceae bacterium]|nr:hypothetical protein [Fimbriimonadaceae bacterium]
MSETLEFWLLTLSSLGVSTLLGFAFVKHFRGKQAPVPKANAIFRISSLGTVYRSQFIGERPEGWAFTPPIQRDNHVPIKVGEPMVLETVVDQGVAVYRATLKARSHSPSMIIVERPSFWRVEDRRDSVRIADVGHMTAKLDGDTVGLLDMSACGARIRSQARHEAGKRVKLEVGGFDDAIHAWVIGTVQKGDRYVMRLRFEEETDMSPMVGA